MKNLVKREIGQAACGLNNDGGTVGRYAEKVTFYLLGSVETRRTATCRVARKEKGGSSCNSTRRTRGEHRPF